MRRFGVTLTVAGIIGLVGGPAAATPTCSDVLEIDNHGHHVVADYVMGTGHANEAWPPRGGVVGAEAGDEGAALPGGPGPAFHFANDIPPGASFCTDSAAPGSPPGRS
jgi:hypothetical protein